jgi:hypothetical protein
MNHQIRDGKKNLSRERLTGKRGVDPDLLTYFDSEKERERENLEEFLFVCVGGFFSPLALQCRVR